MKAKHAKVKTAKRHKVKTHSGAKKRFKKLKSGLVKVARAYHRHLLTQKSAKRKRSLRKGRYVEGSDKRRLINLLPY